jgi:hypothetical protein
MHKIYGFFAHYIQQTTNNKVACFVAVSEFCGICFGNEWETAYGPGDHLHRYHRARLHRRGRHRGRRRRRRRLRRRHLIFLSITVCLFVYSAEDT